MSRLVIDDGPPTARIAVIGEALGATEERLGRPFSGAAGYKLDEWMRQAGVERRACYVTNVIPWRPEANKIETVSAHDLAEWTDKLHDRLAQLADPWVIVPTGNTALRALTGKAGITKHRGSIYAYTDRRGRTVKVIPTLHPAAIFRQPAWERRSLCDWRRIADDALFRDLRLPVREHYIRPSLSDVESYVADAERDAERLSLDIETPGGRVACIAFSYDPAFSITVPTTLDYWQTETTLAEVWDLIRRLCDLPCAKVLQNGLFDTYYLAEDHGIALRNWHWDTMAMHHCLDSTDAHTLACMASVDTRQPFWKDDATDPLEMARYADDLSALWTYNGIDAAVQRELCDVYRGRLDAAGQLPFYAQHYAALFQPLLSLMRRGIRVDERTRHRRHTRLLANVISLQDALSVLAGEPLYGKVSLSPKRVARFLYETLGLPKQVNRSTGGVTTAEVTIRRLLLKYGKDGSSDPEWQAIAALRALGSPPPRELYRKFKPYIIREAGELILDIRRKQKLTEFYQAAPVDPDGRMRCSIRFTTDTGRLAARESPKGTGRNLFNVDREVRDTYLPEPGMVFVEADLAQAEDRVVGMLTQNSELIEHARSMPWEVDVHRRNAAKMFGIAEAGVTKAQRYLGKKVKHACVDSKTEVLTPFGWRRISALYDDPVAVWEPQTSQVWFQRPEAVHSYQHNGTLAVFEAQAFSQHVTLEHTMPYMTNRRVKTTAATGIRPSFRLPTAGFYASSPAHESRLRYTADVRLAVAIQADGHITPSRRVEFHLKKHRKIGRVCVLLDAANVEWKLSRRRDGSVSIRTIQPPESAFLWLEPDKAFGPKLLRLSGFDLDAFLDELHHWDGSFAETRHHKREVYLSSRLENVEWVQTIAHLRGRQCLIRRGTGVWIASLNRRRFARAPVMRQRRYVGVVWCLTVSTGFFFVRRCGSISVTGNSNYGMRGQRLADELLKDGYVHTPDECQRMIDAALHPAIGEWHRRVRAQVLAHRCLVNSWGRMRSFEYERLDDETYRAAYCWQPQSEIPMLLNQYGFLPLVRWLAETGRRSVINLQVYDSLLVSAPPDEVWDVMQFVRTSLERPRRYAGQALTIPVTFTIGSTWKGSHEFIQPPKRGDVDAAVQACLAEMHRL